MILVNTYMSFDDQYKGIDKHDNGKLQLILYVYPFCSFILMLSFVNAIAIKFNNNHNNNNNLTPEN